MILRAGRVRTRKEPTPYFHQKVKMENMTEEGAPKPTVELDKTVEEEKDTEAVKTTFSEVEVEGAKKLKCGGCDKILDKEQAMKRHITQKHTNVVAKKVEKAEAKKAEKRKVEVETAVREEDEEDRRKTLSSRMLEKYGGGGGGSQSVSVDDILNWNKKEVAVEKMETEPAPAAEVVEVINNTEDISVMKADIVELKAENAELRAKVELMKTEIETKDELLEAKAGRCDKLEEEKIVMTGKFNEMFDAAGDMFKELQERKDNGGNMETAESKKKLKKANDDLKSAEKNLAESIKHCGEEANRRHAAEAELARNAGMVEALNRALTMITGQQGGPGSSQGAAGGPAGTRAPAGRPEGRREDSREECGDWQSVEGCPRHDCRYAHTQGRGKMASQTAGSQAGRTASQRDCFFWLAGDCWRLAGDCNKGKHSQDKYGTRPFRPRAGSAEGGRISPGANGARQVPAWEARQAPTGDARQASNWGTRQEQDFRMTQVTAPAQAVTGGVESQQQLLTHLLQQVLQQPGQLQPQQGSNYRC